MIAPPSLDRDLDHFTSLKIEIKRHIMEYNTSFSTSFQEQCLQTDPVLDDQQISYFPSLWTDTASVEFSPEDNKVQIAPMPRHMETDSDTGCSHMRSPSTSSSESSRRCSQGPRPEGKRDRRRAQNRAAQRAYRERKEHVRQELEVQVKEWQEKHQLLRESYVDQAQEVQRLKQHIDNLQMQLLVAQDTSIPDDSNLCNLEVWTGFDWKTT